MYSIKDSGAKVTDIWVRENGALHYMELFYREYKRNSFNTNSNSDKTITIAKEDTKLLMKRNLK